MPTINNRQVVILIDIKKPTHKRDFLILFEVAGFEPAPPLLPKQDAKSYFMVNHQLKYLPLKQHLEY